MTEREVKALTRALNRVQALEHERQWCETEDVSDVEEALEDAVLDLREILSPANRPENAPLPDVARLLAQQPAAPAEALGEERIRELLDIEQEHKGMLELRLNNYTLRPGLMDLSMAGETAKLFAAGVVGMFRDGGAENNFEVQVELRDPAAPHEHYLLLIQRLNRPTPAEQRAAALGQAEALREENKRLRAALEWFADDKQWYGLPDYESGWFSPATLEGRGRARAALAQAEAAPGSGEGSQ